MGITIALAGNPNSGKTTLFNFLTGANQYVGNWPGVTVEKKEGKLKSDKSVVIADLPGIYSLSPYTPEEIIARKYLINNSPDAIINIVDGTNLERNLYLTTQLLEIGIPVIVAVNMLDVVKKRGDVINIRHLRENLNCSVFEISAMNGDGIDEVVKAAISAAKSARAVAPLNLYSTKIDESIKKIETLLNYEKAERREFFAIKLFERDKEIEEELKLDSNTKVEIDNIIAHIEAELEDDGESIITDERYTFIGDIMKNGYIKKNKSAMSLSDKIDSIVTNRILALPIFAVIMFVVYYISVTTVGTIVTDFTNDVFFGEWIAPAAAGFLESINTAPFLEGLIVDGIIGGVGAVLGFVPQIFVLFIFLAILEECGYMSRIAFVLDRVFRKFGLSGKSFIPMLIGTGCGIPGVMASRTIENERDRRMTIMTTTFMPCGAKLPIIALISGALFGGAWWVAPSAYFVGIAAIIVSGIILKKTKPFLGDPAPFVMELPAYHMPKVGTVLRSMWERGWSFIKKAGTIILLSTIFIWLASSYGFVDGHFGAVDTYEYSILGYIGNAIAWIFIPLGFGNAKATVATFLGLVAKENVVSTFGILYNFGEVSEDGSEFWTLLAQDYTALQAYSFLIFNLLCAPCFAAIGAIKREMNNTRWTWFAIIYQTLFAYIVSLIIYQFGLMFTGAINPVGIVFAAVSLAFMLYMLFRKPSQELQTAKANA